MCSFDFERLTRILRARVYSEKSLPHGRYNNKCGNMMVAAAYYVRINSYHLTLDIFITECKYFSGNLWSPGWFCGNRNKYFSFLIPPDIP